jgi:hypothetical protein
MKISTIVTWVLAAPVAIFFAYELFKPTTFYAYELFKPTSFSDADINQAKAEMKAELQKQNGVSVTEIQLIRETPRKLTGFAKLHYSAPETGLLAGYSLDITRHCGATMGDGDRYIW